MEKFDLPKLTKQQQTFVIAYITNGNKATDAYKQAYNTSNMKLESIYAEASKMLKNPKIKAWIDYYKQNQENVIEEKIRYSALEAFNEFEELKILALVSKDNNNNPLIGEARKAVENKCKLAGHFNDSDTNNISVGVEMPTIKVDGKEINFNIGD